jgi:hypothetical protein
MTIEQDGIQALITERRADRDAAIDRALRAEDAIRKECAECSVAGGVFCRGCALAPWRGHEST